MNSRQRLTVSLGGVAALWMSTLLPSCGGSGGGSPSTPSTPNTTPATTSPAPPLVTLPGTLLYQGTFTGFVGGDAGRGAFSVPGAGTLHVAIEWQPSAANIGAALTSQACTEVTGAFSGSCANIGDPQQAPTGSPRTFQAAVTTSVQAYVYVNNFTGPAATGTTRVSFVAAAPAPSPTPTSTPTPAPSPTPTGNFPACTGTRPAGPSCASATGRCRDNTYTCAQNTQGSCSSHDGLQCVFCPGPLCD